MQLSGKAKTFLLYFYCIFGIYVKFWTFWKHFWSYWLRKTCLLKCKKGLVSENPLALNVLRSPKNCWNLLKSTFILSYFFIILSQLEIEKVIFRQIWDFRSPFLTRWLPITSILVVIGRNYSYHFKSNCLKNWKLFVIFHCIFEI